MKNSVRYYFMYFLLLFLRVNDIVILYSIFGLWKHDRTLSLLAAPIYLCSVLTVCLLQDWVKKHKYMKTKSRKYCGYR